MILWHRGCFMKPSIAYDKVKIFFIFAIFILSACIGYAAGLQKKVTSSIETVITPPVSINTPTPTRGPEEPWKHFQYKGSSDTRKLGFGIDYPGNWQKPVIKDNLTNTRVYFDDGFEITYGDFYDRYERKIMSFDEVVDSYSTYHTVTDFTLNGVRGKKLVSQTTADPGGVQYIFPGIYVVRYYLPESDSKDFAKNYPIAEKKYDKMITSLYFADENGDVNPIDPETKWHIFKESHYSFKYPANWHQDGTSCPAFSEAIGGRYTFYVCFSSTDHPRTLSKLRLQEGDIEVSKSDTIVGGHKGIKQVTKFAFHDSYLYTVVIYISDNGNELEIRAAGIPEDEKESEFALVDSIVGTFKLNF